MNQIFATAFQGLFLYLVLALLVAVLLGVLRSPRFKGWRGERAVQNTIRRQLNPLVYVDLHNVTLPTRDGSTQIDHLIFSPYGLFVLETKNYQGWIFGSERQAQWTQQIFKKRSRFQNPLRQNYKHTKAVQELLGVAPEQVHSVIAFVGECEFKTEMPPNVTRGDGFVSFIQSFTQQVWGPEQMQDLLDKLEEVRLQPGRATNKQHVAHVKELQAAKSQAKPKSRPTPEPVAQPVRPPPPDAVDILLEPVTSAAAEVAVLAEAPSAAPVAVKLANEVRECPQCTWPLRKLVMQRGPLAGQGIWRCTNTAACSFVREDSSQS
ncbi:NERD domain-containing protein [Comamonas sp. Y33R10-2]|uniref:nuclease-related domain-containing protein n=1 Tax=Comamonas sp. Y33R10-2 TaxID=2853257 RepID=UPI001C5C87FE|nr:nuclease-related domain-containing protein [Comamonas sp. Y33R10-2]QXZ08581.1 NERD domain-containing protein [Comamonas sp. Y33R10-2]